MKVEEIAEQARETLGSKRIYGEPYEKNGITIIPAARLMGGAGGGNGIEKTTDDTPGGAAAGTSSGVGYGMAGSPAGAFVINGDQVKWVPAIDVNRMLFGFQLVLIVFFLVVRSVAKARAQRVI
jgi:uncharacterized spore protein YtfJ